MDARRSRALLLIEETPWGETVLVCPLCGCRETHVSEASGFLGTDPCEQADGLPAGVEIAGRTSDRRGALGLTVSGECGHGWTLMLQQRRGSTAVTVRIPRAGKEAFYAC
jgi:hypothetical protein